jgi:hypothetical protein
MSFRPHPTKGDGWWVIDIGRSKDRKRIAFYGTKLEAARRARHAKAGYYIEDPTVVALAHDKKNPPFVYFIQQGSDGPIKIGFVHNDLVGRIAKLQVANPYKLNLLLVLEGASHSLEQELHLHFAKDRLMGEWFAPSQALLNYIYLHQPKFLKARLKRIYQEYLAALEELSDEHKQIALGALSALSIADFCSQINKIEGATT